MLIILYREALFAGPNLVGKYVVELILKQLSVWNWNWFKEYMPIFMAIRRNTWWRRCNYFLSSFTCSMTLCIFHLVTHFQEPLNEIESVANIPKLLWEIFDVRLGLVVCNKYDIWYVTVTSLQETHIKENYDSEIKLSAITIISYKYMFCRIISYWTKIAKAIHNLFHEYRWLMIGENSRRHY